ncbi:MAG TPA: VCBS repeat-containing protein [Bacillota bacterium]|nr:VCBS repeat-containing protein [Bacillota bacterium]
MKFNDRRWLVCVVLLIVIQIAASPASYKTVFNETKFQLESILQVLAVDADTDQQKEILVTGKNYVDRELFIYCLDFKPGFTPVVKWRSDNLFEERSIIWTALGNFGQGGQQLLVLTTKWIYLYRVTPENLQLIQQIGNETEPLAVAVADMDGDGFSELLTAKVGAVTAKAYNCVLEIWKFQDNKFNKVHQSDLLGNIRSLTAGDLDNDGITEIVAEEGLRLDTGNIHVYNFKEDRLVEKTQFKLANNGAVYAMKIREFPDGKRLLTGSTKGKINQLGLSDGQVFTGLPELSLKSSIVDIEAADLNDDGKPELITASYPSKLTILSP